MRVSNWFATLVGAGALLAGGQSLFAQNAPRPYPAAAPPPTTFNASLSDPEYGGYPAVTPPIPPQFAPGAYGPTVNPYPAISPYEHSFSDYQNFGGLWDHTESNAVKQWYTNVDFLFVRTKTPEGVFGNPHSQSYLRQVRSFIDATTSSTGGGTGGGTDGGTGGGTGGSGSTATPATSDLFQREGFFVDTPSSRQGRWNYYDSLDLSSLNDITTQGARFTLGFWNPDKSGLAGQFWFSGNGNTLFDARDSSTRRPEDLKEFKEILRALQNGEIPLPITVDEIGAFVDLSGRFTPRELFEQNLLNLRSLPVGDGTTRGQSIPYDLYFAVKVASQQIGTGLDYYFTPLFERKWFTLRPSVGAKYLNVRESLDFVGIDSGLLYTESGDTPNRDYKAQSIPNGLDDNQDGIIDNAGFHEEGSTGGTSGGGTSGQTLFVPIFPFLLTRASLNIDTTTNLFGPEAGLRYDLGGEYLHVFGETKFGLMANFEKIKLRGNNIGSTTRINGNQVNFPEDQVSTQLPNPRTEMDQALIIPTPDNLHPNAFSDEQTHAHISPLIEQSIMAESQVFKYVPVLKHVWPLQAAKLRAGYTLIWVGDMIETNRSINYQGKPTAGLFPKINPSHDSWWTGSWTVGASWDF